MGAICSSTVSKCSSKVHKEEEKEKKARPTAVNVVMLKKFTTNVPKYANRRKLIKEGRIKSIYISKNADHNQVHRKIEAAFSIANFLVLDCYKGHHLSISTNKFVDGRLAVQRRGCLYLCEVRCIATYIQWNLCIMDTLGPTKGVQIIKVS